MTQLLPDRKRSHTHTAVRTYIVSQRLGVPYEVERTVCADCRELLAERRLRRTAA
jgi:NMD protein affecting ribosome stability and mRNA decay